MSQSKKVFIIFCICFINEKKGASFFFIRVVQARTAITKQTDKQTDRQTGRLTDRLAIKLGYLPFTTVKNRPQKITNPWTLKALILFFHKSVDFESLDSVLSPRASLLKFRHFLSFPISSFPSRFQGLGLGLPPFRHRICHLSGFLLSLLEWVSNHR